MTSPAPIPTKIDATNNKAEVSRNMKPTPSPISVVPQLPKLLYSFFTLFAFPEY